MAFASAPVTRNREANLTRTTGSGELSVRLSTLALLGAGIVFAISNNVLASAALALFGMLARSYDANATPDAASIETEPAPLHHVDTTHTDMSF